MKQPENNEIDSLLRKLASRQGSVSAELNQSIGNELSATSAHLDADELSSYAEGALPESTRVRYTSHLADCNDCRRIVTQLSLAFGPQIKEPKGSHDGATSTWKQALMALFAPAVLRYAVPALTLLVVAVAFFAWRQQQREASFVATRQAQVSNDSQPTQGNIDPAKGNSGVVLDAPMERRLKTEQAQKSSATSPADKAGVKDQKTAEEQKSAETFATPSADTSVVKERDIPKNETAPVSQPAYAPEPASPRPAKSSVSTVAKAKPQVEDETKLADASAGRRESERSRSSGSGEVTTANAPPAGKDDGRQQKKRLETRASVAGSRADEQTEARTVNGRQFQRRNGAWVDTAYKSSAPLTTVARGSEQYRALIADEPEIGVIAKELSGDVILVWKGRAYRIH